MKPHLESRASCSKMSTPTQDFWNCVPEEILAHVFSYLPFEDRHTAFQVCQRWAVSVSTRPVWSFTEINCNTDDHMNKSCVVQRLPQFLCHITHLKIVFDQLWEVNRRHAAQTLDMLAWQRHRVRALTIVCCGRSPDFYSCQEILYSFRRLCLTKGKTDFHYIDFRQIPFTLDSRLIRLIASSNPNLHTLLVNNHPSGIKILRPETIVEVLRVCPKLSALGIYHASLSEDVFQELLKPSRGPFLFLDIFCEGLDRYIPEELWSALIEKHPQLRVGLEFGPMVPRWKMSSILMPNIPIVALQFNTFTYMMREIQYVADSYSRTLERLVLRTIPSDDLNVSLIELASKCVRLKEIHCSFAVRQGVIDAFLLCCRGLTRYTLSM
ncbi:F-box/LRR-repeat protein 8-like isoform X3 [Hemicordylus capensis]|uniref:F-box/LRR-repeat protein 8-like isoform X3 n=1 Tax=Hemicordylus capensis TaxID=884348 RepID=UPI00230481AE|nr:F-box/LRR-repeat protein 8-like isoform X3 [Hemicordylus capensis]XP_053126805.1 F-box/LRR-repeat protein 8-like isoform X3 [Hemicordylus capensis]XP_053126806.1 F-box/LRR-repeat protein 8-like isoform X3 [Hemicordylus capensis]XP_053126808.1 F-box/LRR-repeat protein 8-like isoform X3 [Hemicordylus capensis]XP_053126809.1 F-box/LRR-repeat protein 8-like isoform X3 [Hemicordylus capensis]